MLIPQTKFLEFLAQEGKKYPNFRLRMVANVGELIEENGQVCGVRYQSTDGWHAVRALLTVGADGRFSKVRHLAGFEPIKTSPPMDILWFELPHLPGDEHSDRLMGGFGKGRLLAVFDRGDHWQIGYVFRKGQYQQLRAEGIEAYRKSIIEVEPRFTQHVESLREWNQCSLLSVEANRCPVWYKPGLLLIGDAAHVMSPVGGVGINYAVQDAVVATNVLTRPLHQGKVRVEDLQEVQRQREFPIRVVQAMQSAMQTRMIAGALQSPGSFTVPWQMRMFFKIPLLRDIPARLMAFGVKRVRLQPEA
jgi:2-polyprenyl-6-methoxyphenol hydroxylase-like FAD-dependent oxidoreductase